MIAVGRKGLGKSIAISFQNNGVSGTVIAYSDYSTLAHRVVPLIRVR